MTATPVHAHRRTTEGSPGILIHCGNGGVVTRAQISENNAVTQKSIKP